MAYVAGWDGGGTKTSVVYMDSNGQVLGRDTYGPLNINGNAREQVLHTVHTALDAMVALPGGLSGCDCLQIATAGVSNPSASALLTEAVRKAGYQGPLQLAGDHEAALYGAVGPAGAVLIAGTGSICYGKNRNGEIFRCGGWGYKIDDEGSGYAIGRDILTAVVRAEDRRIPLTYLRSQVFDALRITSVQELIRFVYDPATDKKQMAALAPLLLPALDQKDAAAQAIAHKAAKELTLLASAVIDGLALAEGEIALMGSILTEYAAIRDGVKASLAAAYPRLACIGPRGDAALGAAAMALERFQIQGGNENA